MKTMVFLSRPCSSMSWSCIWLADQRVERREGLVHEQDLGVGAERAGEADALLHAAGQLRRVAVLVAGEADRLDPLAARARAARPAARR